MRPFPTDLYIPIFFLYFAAALGHPTNLSKRGENLQEKSKIDLERLAAFAPLLPFFHASNYH